MKELQIYDLEKKIFFFVASSIFFSGLLWINGTFLYLNKCLCSVNVIQNFSFKISAEITSSLRSILIMPWTLKLIFLSKLLGMFKYLVQTFNRYSSVLFIKQTHMTVQYWPPMKFSSTTNIYIKHTARCCLFSHFHFIWPNSLFKWKFNLSWCRPGFLWFCILSCINELIYSIIIRKAIC